MLTDEQGAILADGGYAIYDILHYDAQPPTRARNRIHHLFVDLANGLLAHQHDRERLRRVIGLAKSWREECLDVLGTDEVSVAAALKAIDEMVKYRNERDELLAALNDKCDESLNLAENLRDCEAERDELQRQLHNSEIGLNECRHWRNVYAEKMGEAETERDALAERVEAAQVSVDWLVKALTERSMQILPDEIEGSVKRLAAALRGEGE